MTAPSLDYYAIEELLTDEERAARDRARRLFRAKGTWTWFRSGRHGNARQTRGRSLHFERQQMLDRQRLHRGCKSGVGKRRRRTCWRIRSGKRRTRISRKGY